MQLGSQVGKLDLAAAEAGAVADKSNRHLFISERTTGEQYLIDTGAAISVFPWKRSSPTQPTDFLLYAANGSAIKTYGETRCEVNLGLRRPYIIWTFVLADVTKPIIGADFLFHHNLMVDLQGQQLVGWNLRQT